MTNLQDTLATNAVDFFKAFTKNWPQDSYLNLVGIGEGQPVYGESWLVSELEAKRERITSVIERWNNAGRNIYLTVNPVKTRLTTKPGKGDLLAGYTTHIDIDCNASALGYAAAQDEMDGIAADYLQMTENKPNCIVHSGNGLHVYWSTPDGKPFSQDDTEAVNRALHQDETRGKVDGTWNADRLLRVPFTLNHPNAKKLKMGYPSQPTTAHLLYQQTGGTMPQARWDELRARAPAAITHGKAVTGPKVPAGTGGAPAQVEDWEAVALPLVDTLYSIKNFTSFEDLPTPIRKKFMGAAATNTKLKKTWEGKVTWRGKDGAAPDDSRSAFEVHLATQMHKAGFSHDEIFSLLWVHPLTSLRPDYPELGEWKTVRRMARLAAKYCITAPAPVVEAELEAMIARYNATYAHVRAGGGDMIVYREKSLLGDFYQTEIQTVKSFVSFEESEKVVIGENSKGEPIRKAAPSLWLHDPNHRRCKSGFIIDPKGTAGPEYYNRWMGYGVTPKAGDWSLMRNHIRDVIAGGNAEYDAYLMGWLAWMFQNPTEVPGVAVVLRGGKGSGKSTLGDELRAIWGSHGTKVTNPEHLTGKFNGHLGDCVFLFADEAVFAGDRAAEGALKSLITAPSRMSEGKGLKAFEMPNYLHILMATNSAWAVPASSDERRFAVFDVSNARVNDLAYFAALRRQQIEGGRAAMAHDLLEYDLSNFEVREFPETDALKDQRTASLTGVEKWMFEIIEREHVLEDCYSTFPDDGIISKQRLHDSYAEWSKGTHFKGSALAIGKLVQKLGLRAAYQKRGTWESASVKMTWVYNLGNLDELRENFAEVFKVSFTPTSGAEAGDEDDTQFESKDMARIRENLVHTKLRTLNDPR